MDQVAASDGAKEGMAHLNATPDSNPLRIKGVPFALDTFVFYVTAEMSVGLWGSSCTMDCPLFRRHHSWAVPLGICILQTEQQDIDPLWHLDFSRRCCGHSLAAYAGSATLPPLFMVGFILHILLMTERLGMITPKK